MSDTKVIKIAKILLGVTNNGTPRAYIWQEGSDLNSQVEAIDVIGDQALYVATRHVGEEIEVILGKFINVKIPQDFITASSKPTYARVIGLFKKAITSIDFAVNGSRPSIDLDTAKEIAKQDIATLLAMQDVVLDTLKESKGKIAKEIVANFGIPKDKQTLDSCAIINSIARQTLSNINKDYRVEV